MKKLTNLFLASSIMFTANCFAADVKTDTLCTSKKNNAMLKKQAVLTKLGVDLEIPVKTRMVIKYLIESGMSASGALDALSGGIDFATANAMTIAGHPKEQEMEADSIALELTNRINLDVTSTACKMFEGEKGGGMFDQHPSYSDRRANVACEN